jgi:hypothetical protein
MAVFFVTEGSWPCVGRPCVERLRVGWPRVGRPCVGRPCVGRPGPCVDGRALAGCGLRTVSLHRSPGAAPGEGRLCAGALDAGGLGIGIEVGVGVHLV